MDSQHVVLHLERKMRDWLQFPLQQLNLDLQNQLITESASILKRRCLHETTFFETDPSDCVCYQDKEIIYVSSTGTRTDVRDDNLCTKLMNMLPLYKLQEINNI